MEPEITQAAAEAVHAQKNAAEAVEVARAVQASVMQENTTQSLVDALRQVFGENEKTQRFVDVSRIPLICKSIVDMHENIKDIKGSINTTNTDHEARIRIIERNQWKWIGVVTVLTPILTIALAAFLNMIFHA